MKFATINPTERTVAVVEAANLEEAMKPMGLTYGQIDFGTLWRDPVYGHGTSIVVYQFGLFRGKDGHYFSIGPQLYEGNAVVFDFNRAGDTVGLHTPPMVQFYRNANAVERAIDRGEIRRPSFAINNEIAWQWPQSGGSHV